MCLDFGAASACRQLHASAILGVIVAGDVTLLVEFLFRMPKAQFLQNLATIKTALAALAASEFADGPSPTPLPIADITIVAGSGQQLFFPIAPRGYYPTLPVPLK